MHAVHNVTCFNFRGTCSAGHESSEVLVTRSKPFNGESSLRMATMFVSCRQGDTQANRTAAPQTVAHQGQETFRVAPELALRL